MVIYEQMPLIVLLLKLIPEIKVAILDRPISAFRSILCTFIFGNVKTLARANPSTQPKNQITSNTHTGLHWNGQPGERAYHTIFNKIGCLLPVGNPFH